VARSDAALLVLVPAIAVRAVALVGLLRRQRRAENAGAGGLAEVGMT
jgi:hypothetical protein